MKRLKSLLIATVLFLGTSYSIHAQAKTAHVDVNEIISKMPAMLDAQKQLEKLQETYRNELNTMVNEFQAKVKKYQAESEKPDMTEAIFQTRKAEVDDMQKRIKDYEDNAQKDLLKKESDLVNPLQEKIKASITKVGKEKGFQYILNSSQISLVLLADGPDLTADVKKDLGF
jgi:outer membrane protein